MGNFMGNFSAKISGYVRHNPKPDLGKLSRLYFPPTPQPHHPTTTTTHPMECWPIATVRFKPPSVALVARLGFKVIDDGFSGQLAGLGANPFAQSFTNQTKTPVVFLPGRLDSNGHVPETDSGNIHHQPPYPSPRSSVNCLAGGVSDSLSGNSKH